MTSRLQFYTAMLATALIASASLTGSAALAAGPAQGPGSSPQTVNLLHAIKNRGEGHHGGKGNSHYRGQSRGHSMGHHRGHHPVIGFGALIIGGLVLSEAARAEHRRQHYSDWQRCASTYRSFESNTGMYTGYDGQRHVCPYLR